MRFLPSPGLLAALSLVLVAGCDSESPAGGEGDGPAPSGDTGSGFPGGPAAGLGVVPDVDAPAGASGVVTGAEPGAVLVFRGPAGDLAAPLGADGAFQLPLDPDGDTVAWLVEGGHVTAVASVSGVGGDHPAFAPGAGPLTLRRDGARLVVEGDGVAPRQAASTGDGLACPVALGVCDGALADRVDASDADGDGIPDAIDLDDDADSVPDAVDPDDDGDGLFDSLDPSPGIASVTADGGADGSAEPLVAFTNLKLPGETIEPSPPADGDPWPHTDEVVLALEWDPGSEAGSVSAVTAVALPFAAADATVAPGAGQYAFTGADAATTYPAGGAAWDGALHKADLAGSERWTVWVSPRADLQAGDMLVFEARTASGTRVLTVLIDFPFRTPPVVEEAVSGLGIFPVEHPATLGSSIAPIPFGGDLVLRGARPLTDATGEGEPICGLAYRADVFYVDADGRQIGDGVISAEWADPETYPCDGQVEVTLDATTYLPEEVDGTEVAAYKVDFTAVGARGDNASDMLWYAREDGAAEWGGGSGDISILGYIPTTWDVTPDLYDYTKRWFAESQVSSVCTDLRLRPDNCSPTSVMIGASWPWVSSTGVKHVWILEVDTQRSEWGDVWSVNVGGRIQAASLAVADSKARTNAENFMAANYYSAPLGREPQTLSEWTSSINGGWWTHTWQ